MSKQNGISNSNDIFESASDKAHLKPDTGFIDLPEVKDIPGQEHVTVAPLGELRDVTISSADEEGAGLFDDEDNVSEEEKEMLKDAAETMDTPDEWDLKSSMLDTSDFDGELLNEEGDLSGNDLDVPGAEDDDADEATGSEDEENNEYSLGGENHDD